MGILGICFGLLNREHERGKEEEVFQEDMRYENGGERWKTCFGIVSFDLDLEKSRGILENSKKREVKRGRKGFKKGFSYYELSPAEDGRYGGGDGQILGLV